MKTTNGYAYEEVYDRAAVRKLAKKKAFATVRKKFGWILLATLLACLPGLLLSGVSSWQTMQETVAMVQDPAGYVMDTMTQSGGNAGYNFLTFWISIFVLLPISMGLYHYYMNTARGREGSVGLIFSRFQSGKRYGGALKIGILVMVFTFLWSLVVGVAVGIPLGITMVITGPAQIVLLVISLVIAVAALLLYTAKILSYEAAYMFGVDYENIGAMKIMRATQRLFQGHYKDLLVFLLSFIGWYIFPALCGVAFGLVFTSVMIFHSLLLTGWMLAVGIVLGVVLLVYSLFVQAYQSIAFINLVDNMRLLIGDSGWLTGNGDTMDRSEDGGFMNE